MDIFDVSTTKICLRLYSDIICVSSGTMPSILAISLVAKFLMHSYDKTYQSNRKYKLWKGNLILTMKICIKLTNSQLG